MKNKILFLALLTANALYAQEERKFAATSTHPGPFASIGITDNPIVVNGFDVIYKDEVVKEYFGWGYNKETGKMEYVKDAAEKDTVRLIFDNDQKYRWLSMDPILKANESPYAGFANNPVLFVDPDGREINLSNLTVEQLTGYNAIIKILSSSDLFSYYYQQLIESKTVYTIKAASTLENGREVGGYFNRGAHEVGVGENFHSNVVAQELFHAYQYDGNFYDNNNPPYSTIETEGDVMTLYIMLESGSGFPVYGNWINDILNHAFESIPSSVEVGSEEYQRMFQTAVDDRIQYYKEQGMDTPTYTSPNTGEKPKALENVIKGVEQTSKNDNQKEKE